jgi:hypothetical protein
MRKGRVSLFVSVRIAGRRHKGRLSLRVSGKLGLEKGLAPSAIVCSGRVSIRLAYRGKTLGRKAVDLTKACAFSETLTIKARQLAARDKPAVSISFGGNPYLLAASARKRV